MTVLLIGLVALVVFLLVAYFIKKSKEKIELAEAAREAKWDKSTVDWAAEKAKIVKAAPVTPVVKTQDKLRITEPATSTPPSNPSNPVDLGDSTGVLALIVLDEGPISTPVESHHPLVESSPETHHSYDHSYSSSSHDSTSSDSSSSDSGSSDSGSSDAGGGD